jgi:hypothetical protein
VSFTLDAAILPERAILRRLEALPSGSRSDWLRSLLTQGLLVEGRWHQGLATSPGTRGAGCAPLPPSQPADQQDDTSHEPPAGLPMTEPESPSGEPKPFARLRQVIG